MGRLWNCSCTGLYKRTKLLPASWHSRKPDKPNGKKQKAPKKHPQITETLGRRLLQNKDIFVNFEAFLQQFFYQAAVIPALQCGIIPSDPLTVSGDGTAVHTHASPNGHIPKHLLPVDDYRLSPRHYSDHDATWGYDSDLEKHYYGYTLFQLSCYNEKLHVDVPRLLCFTSAVRHDSASFLVAFHEMEKHMPIIKPHNICLDSAMDNYPTYRLLKDRGISAFIDLNSNRGRPKSIPDSIRIDKDGTLFVLPACG